ncbi:hypothetical protein OAN30_01410 [Flavobacteriaceae bacterium]|nr:hypothetical protein [Flavobacteriaceae bacterium]MDC0331063.1 hypothetical protein [Flavobacteriaceae bacterium]
MKPNCYFKSAELPLIIFLLFILLSSCTVYQNVPDNDGIYTKEIKRTRVIVENSKEYDEYENNYFTKELERLDGINGTDIFTDIETYSSVDNNTNNSSETNEGYMINNAWGYSDSDQIVINLDLNSTGFGWDNYLNFYNPYFNYGNFSPWINRAWRLRWRYGIGNYSPWYGYGYFHSPFFNPFFNSMSGYGSFNWRNYYGNGYTNNGFRNYNYGRRNYSYNTSNTRNYINSRSINSSNKRVNFTNGRSKRTANNINVDKLASRLKLDKSKIKVYNNTKEFTAGMKKTRNSGRKNSSVRSNSSTKRPSYKARSSGGKSNYSPRTRSNNSSRSSSIRRGSSSSRSSSSRSGSSSKSSSSKRGE